MGRLLRLQLILTVVGVVLCAPVIILRRGTPPFDIIPDLNWCSGVLCYKRLVPNLSTEPQAYTIFSQSEDLRYIAQSNYYESTRTALPTRFEIRLREDESGYARLRWINLLIESKNITLEKVLPSLGHPCRVNATGNRIWLYYPSVAFEIVPRTAPNGRFRLELTSVVRQISLSGDQDACRAVSERTVQPWRGLTLY